MRQGPYVLVLLNTGHAHRSNRLPAGWLLTTYRSLSRPFRKHVKRIVLVRPLPTSLPSTLPLPTLPNPVNSLLRDCPQPGSQ